VSGAELAVVTRLAEIPSDSVGWSRRRRPLYTVVPRIALLRRRSDVRGVTVVSWLTFDRCAGACGTVVALRADITLTWVVGGGLRGVAWVVRVVVCSATSAEEPSITVAVWRDVGDILAVLTWRTGKARINTILPNQIIELPWRTRLLLK
jgi:hypothetical protein